MKVGLSMILSKEQTLTSNNPAQPMPEGHRLNMGSKTQRRDCVHSLLRDVCMHLLTPDVTSHHYQEGKHGELHVDSQLLCHSALPRTSLTIDAFVNKKGHIKIHMGGAPNCAQVMVARTH